MNENQKGKPKETFKNPLCYQCGRMHSGDFLLKTHPDANNNPEIKIF